jgi:hypothetical protein
VIKATAPPQTENKKLLIIPYTYALVLVTLALWQLIALDSFIPYVGSYLDTDRVTPATTVVAMILIGLEVFSVPFLLRLRLSPLARFCSAVSAFATPLAWAFVTMSGESFNVGYLFADIGFFLWGGISFWVLGGPQATRLQRKAV